MAVTAVSNVPSPRTASLIAGVAPSSEIWTSTYSLDASRSATAVVIREPLVENFTPT